MASAIQEALAAATKSAGVSSAPTVKVVETESLKVNSDSGSL